MPQIYLESFRN